MERYFFDLVNGNGLVRDEQGQIISTRAEISREVSRILTDIAREELPESGEGTISVEVRDERDKPIFTGRLSFETRWHDETATRPK